MQSCRQAAIGLLAIVCFAAAGCTAPLRGPNLGGLYTADAKYHDARRHPVIVIPGILGSKLNQAGTHRIVWGAFEPGFADPGTPDGARLIALPLREGVPLADLSDDVEATAALDRARLRILGLPFELNAYAQILATLGVGGFRDQQLAYAGAVDYGDDHFTCFQFAYDWRRSNVENAARLAAFIEEKRAYLQREYANRYGEPDADITFDLVAHSMGGLIARYYLMYGDQPLPADGALPELTWAGARRLHRVILVGTPSAGSAKAWQQLTRGAQFAAILPKYEPAVLGTMPAIYELLPRPRHKPLRWDRTDGAAIEDLYEPQRWIDSGWGLADPGQARVLARLLPDEPDPAKRRDIALDLLGRCLRNARQFHAALDRPTGLPPGVELHLYAGDAADTPAVIAVDSRSGKQRKVANGPGDGTVLRTSALLDERVGQDDFTPTLRTPIPWARITFLFTDHLGLTRDPVFCDNVLFTLLEAPDTPLSATR